jgi:hypothetical protein
VVTPAASVSSTPTIRQPNPSYHGAPEPSSEDSELYLNRFRIDFAPQLPFVNVSTSMSAHELYQEQPLLWLSIMTVVTPYSTQQIMLSKEMRTIFGREAFVEGSRNVDLLLAILVYTTWSVEGSMNRVLAQTDHPPGIGGIASISLS